MAASLPLGPITPIIESSAENLLDTSIDFSVLAASSSMINSNTKPLSSLLNSSKAISTATTFASPCFCSTPLSAVENPIL